MKTTKLILGFSLLISSVSTSAFNFSSRDFSGNGYEDDDSWGSNPMSLSSGKWNTGPFGGGPFNTDTRNWGFSPWNRGGQNNYLGARNNSPWNSTPWNWNNRNQGWNQDPWNRGGYNVPYQHDPYGNWYGNPYNTGPTPYYEVPNLPQAPLAPGMEKQ